MAEILSFSRNRCTTVEEVDENTLRSACRLHDTLTEAFVEILVALPDLNITNIRGEVTRTYWEECRGPTDYLQKLVGVRVGPGVLKIIKGLIGDDKHCRQLAFMVEECCHGIILSFTKNVLVTSPRPTERSQAIAFYANMVRENPRLYNRCAAFAPGSAVVEDIDPP
jgi:hypothetical protein